MIKGTTECTNKVTFIHITYCSSNEGNFREIQSIIYVYKEKEREREGGYLPLMEYIILILFF